MSKIDAPSGDNNAFKRDPVAETVALLDETANALREVLDQIREGDFGKVAELKKEQQLLRGALIVSYTEKQNVKKLGFSEAPAGAAGALDLDAARAEIGRRLARLRVAGDSSGGVGGSE